MRKISQAAIKRPTLINELSKAFGNQCIVVAIDAKQVDGKWLVHLASTLCKQSSVNVPQLLANKSKWCSKWDGHFDAYGLNAFDFAETTEFLDKSLKQNGLYWIENRPIDPFEHC